MALVLELETFHYPGQPSLFEPVRLSLAIGESVALVGASGSGKSSLVTLLAGLHPQPLGGRWSGRLLGNDMGDGGVAYLGSDPEAFLTGFCATVMEEIGWSLFGQGWSPAQVQQRVEEVAEELHLASILWRDPQRLSGGQQQMVALAAVWARRPGFLLLDEPACKLDPVARGRLQEAVRDLAGSGRAGVLWTTSNLGEVTWCDRVWSVEPAAPARIRSATADEWVPSEATVRPWPLEWSRRWGVGEIPWTSPAPPEWRELAPVPVPASRSAEPALRARNLRYRPPGRDLDLFAGLDWSVERGECVGLVGPNGAGKTTLARLFRGLDRASEGSLLVEGREVERESVSGLAGTVAYTFQEPAHLFMRSRVDAELRLSGELLGLDEAEALARLEDALDLFSLRPHAATHPRELPASAASLLGVALSWFSRARVQILDEPLARLDKPGREVLERVLSAWRQEGITVVVVAHDLDWLCTVCTSIAVLDGGAIVAQGHPGEVLARSQVSAILGRPVFLPGASGRS